MHKHIPVILSLLSVMAVNPAHAQIDQTLWVDASDPSTVILDNNGVVQRWRDKTPHHNDFILANGAPQYIGGGIDIGERASGVTDRLLADNSFSPEGDAFLMFIVVRPRTHVGRIFFFAGNNMSLLQTGDPAVDDILLLQINNDGSCSPPLSPAGIGGTQLYIVSRVPDGTGSLVTIQRFGGSAVSTTVACGPAALHSLNLDQGGTNFPISPLTGSTVFEVRGYTAPVNGPALNGAQSVASPFDDAFIQAQITELATRWNLNQPTPVEVTTWGRIKLMMR